ncbi:carboxypeptidase-like regulatory domain-containing protein [Flavobacterium sp. MFBS3-15]|uniref:carboxypeptidase-like regulatory domain-containing protein n=1 Tax=Flavobacterium sp. MFBS3-15 TaxID=2989816 RepID=UPI0022364A48|nr:carboxypeptidase-like regulatory domain-containing protein [Flavobacterium sp. MFBS3-15]MCW4468797.1 carboxypeptidase-like regulatory domain-containing protein [Flavobacterium sp. MFBS3-15]
MSRQLFSFLCLLCFVMSNAQIKGTIIDSETKQPIPLVNIWVVGDDTGTTANEQGNFELKETDDSKTLLFSAVGYGDVSIKIIDLKSTVIMSPKAIELNEVVIRQKKEKIFRTINALEDEEETYFASSTTVKPRMIARLIPNRSEYDGTPFIKDVTFITVSRSPDSKFNLRLYSVAEDGSPGELLYDKNLICTVKKNKRISTIDLSSYNLKMPEKGFFVAIEWLIIDSNRFDLVSLKYGKALDRKDKHYNIYYDPPFKCAYTDKAGAQWLYEKGAWSNRQNKHNNKYYNFFAEVTLSD